MCAYIYAVHGVHIHVRNDSINLHTMFENSSYSYTKFVRFHTVCCGVSYRCTRRTLFCRTITRYYYYYGDAAVALVLKKRIGLTRRAPYTAFESGKCYFITCTRRGRAQTNRLVVDKNQFGCSANGRRNFLRRLAHYITLLLLLLSFINVRFCRKQIERVMRERTGSPLNFAESAKLVIVRTWARGNEFIAALRYVDRRSICTQYIVEIRPAGRGVEQPASPHSSPPRSRSLGTRGAKFVPIGLGTSSNRGIECMWPIELLSLISRTGAYTRKSYILYSLGLISESCRVLVHVYIAYFWIFQSLFRRPEIEFIQQQILTLLGKKARTARFESFFAASKLRTPHAHRRFRWI